MTNLQKFEICYGHIISQFGNSPWFPNHFTLWRPFCEFLFFKKTVFTCSPAIIDRLKMKDHIAEEVT